MGLLVRNGEIVTDTERYRADIWCEGETITRIGQGLEVPPDAEVIDAAGRYVFPGFIDPHTHIYLPVMGTLAKDSYESGSRAALLGGTTFFMDFITPRRDEEPLAALDNLDDQSKGRSACDFGFHLVVNRFDALVRDQVREIADQGICSLKVFLAYAETLGLDDAALFETLRLAKDLGLITLAHCENATLVDKLQQQLFDQGRTGPEWHYHSRPPRVEAEGTHHLLTFAELTGAPVYVVHLSCAEALEATNVARQRGVEVWVETLMQFLLLDKSYAERKAFEGAKYVMSPPLREAHNQELLWRGLAEGTVSTVGTDHAPFDFVGQKSIGRDDFRKIPSGLPGIEDRVKLLYTHGVLEGRLDLHRFVEVASTRAAKLFGLYPRKGAIAPGADADLVIFDPDHRGTILAETHAMNVDYNPFEGWATRGRAEFVTVRGEVAVSRGAFVGSFDRGRRQ